MNTNDMSMIDGEPDTSRGVRPVPREGVGNLPPGAARRLCPTQRFIAISYSPDYAGQQ